MAPFVCTQQFRHPRIFQCCIFGDLIRELCTISGLVESRQKLKTVVLTRLSVTFSSTVQAFFTGGFCPLSGFDAVNYTNVLLLEW